MTRRKDTDNNEDIRLDKWLWAARFFKTRSIARKAVDGGKIRVNGCPCKPSRILSRGDTLRINRADGEYTVQVIALNNQRRPASEARKLYEESPESIARRELAHADRQLKTFHAPHPSRRPDKKARRQLMEMHRGQGG